MIRSLIINPGSTSTKIGVFEDETQVLDKTLRHEAEEIGQFATVFDQIEFRKQIILSALKEQGIELSSFQVIVGRGGVVKPIPGGTYEVKGQLLEPAARTSSDASYGRADQDAANLLLARM